MTRRAHRPLPSLRERLPRIARHGGVGGALLGGALAIGVVGYHLIAGLGWIDALLNASMILSGMGPVDPLPTDAAKIFASAYAIFSGVAFITAVGIVMAPAVKHFLHRFHLEVASEDDEDDRRPRPPTLGPA
ncbi:MAG: hypothetical protein IT294_03575 [Deltaproteobacteria bacterium]|nr:hypothetical protein [Deltaproteobacteria bacterium]